MTHYNGIGDPQGHIARQGELDRLQAAADEAMLAAVEKMLAESPIASGIRTIVSTPRTSDNIFYEMWKRSVPVHSRE